MSKIRLIVFLFIITAVQTVGLAQRVSNVVAVQEGQDIVVYYDLTSEANISLMVINERLDTYFYPLELDGDIGRKVSAGKDNRIVWHVLDEFEDDVYEQTDIVFCVTARAPYHTFLLLDGGYTVSPTNLLQPWTGGIMIGGVQKVGWYAKGITNFQSTPLWIVDAGLVFRLAAGRSARFYWYVGAGYGERELRFEDVSADMGFMLSASKFVMSFGVTTIGYQYIQANVGIGFIL